jgi:phosphate/sulfate permease
VRVDEVIRSAISRAGVIRVKNAMNPLLWLSPISATICWIAAYVFRDDPILKYAFAGLGALPIIASLVAYFLYFFLDRDRLQSEEFVLRERQLQLKYRQKTGAEIVDPAKEIVRTENLPGGFGHGDRS